MSAPVSIPVNCFLELRCCRLHEFALCLFLLSCVLIVAIRRSKPLEGNLACRCMCAGKNVLFGQSSTTHDVAAECLLHFPIVAHTAASSWYVISLPDFCALNLTSQTFTDIPLSFHMG